jgi:hypothetical protein
LSGVRWDDSWTGERSRVETDRSSNSADRSSDGKARPALSGVGRSVDAPSTNGQDRDGRWKAVRRTNAPWADGPGAVEPSVDAQMMNGQKMNGRTKVVTRWDDRWWNEVAPSPAVRSVSTRTAVDERVLPGGMTAVLEDRARMKRGGPWPMVSRPAAPAVRSPGHDRGARSWSGHRAGGSEPGERGRLPSSGPRSGAGGDGWTIRSTTTPGQSPGSRARRDGPGPRQGRRPGSDATRKRHSRVFDWASDAGDGVKHRPAALTECTDSGAPSRPPARPGAGSGKLTSYKISGSAPGSAR